MTRLRAIDGSVAPPAAMDRRRLLQLGALGGLGLVSLTGRLFQMQVLEGEGHRSRADANRLRVSAVPAPRGILLDRNGIPVVRNRPSFSIAVVPADLPRRPEVVYRRLVKLVGGSPQEFAGAVDRRRDDQFSPVVLRSTRDGRVAQAVQAHLAELPGVQVITTAVREYPDGPTTAHLIGHVGPITEEQLRAASGPDGPYTPHDRVGQAGLEATLEEQLRGARGLRRVEVDASGREVGVLALDRGRPGHNVVLSVDLAFQREVHRILAERIAEFEVASAVVVDPNDGQIAAMAHLPSYENGLFADGISDGDFARLKKDPTRPMLNGAVSSAWPPGSTLKVITALAALQAGVVRPETRIHCGGGIRLPGGAFLGCWTAHGEQDMISALANSCDSYFYQLGGGEPSGRWAGVGPDRLAEWARRFGLGRPTGVELPAEAPGLVPTPAWKLATQGERWYPGDSYISAIGQGFYTATPLQMAMVAATVANGGTLHRPRLVRELRDADGRTVAPPEPEVVGTIPLDGAHMAVVRQGLRAGMLHGVSPYGTRYYGTSWDSEIRELPMAGKTGTSEYGTRGPNGKLPTHGWFIFWAPYESPKIAGSVFVKRGRGAQEAGKTAARIVKAYFGLV
ncbi:MAG TPA: penicillin-binding protein 2 [Chloroflexota bacterium]|jgi:penicillin-binding protein 2|nr:penicillin-binding protein 2 [Chloroflexota bacterium]